MSSGLTDVIEDVLKKMWTKLLTETKRKMGSSLNDVKEDFLKTELLSEMNKNMSSVLNGVWCKDDIG